MSIITSGVGRIGKDAVTRFTQAGEAVTGFSLAMDNGFGDKKQTLWFDASGWGKRYEAVAPHLLKGTQVFVVGEMGEREHEGRVYKTLRLQTLDLVGSKPQEGNTSSSGPRGGAPARERPQPATAPVADDFESDSIPF
jgi:single-strand DNA-binding protein